MKWERTKNAYLPLITWIKRKTMTTTLAMFKMRGGLHQQPPKRNMDYLWLIQKVGSLWIHCTHASIVTQKMTICSPKTLAHMTSLFIWTGHDTEVGFISNSTLRKISEIYVFISNYLLYCEGQRKVLIKLTSVF